MSLFTQEKRTFLLTAAIAALSIVICACAVFGQTAIESAADSNVPVPYIAAPPPEPAVYAGASPSYRLAVNFEENSLELAPLSFAALDSMSVLFAKHNRNRYEVHGYSCPNTGDRKVIRLSLQRVERIVEHLASLGIPGENILTVVNAPKSTAGTKACTDDRQVDIISSGVRWRMDELSAKQAELQAAVAASASSDVADSLRAVMREMSQRMASMERPEPPPLPPPQPITMEEGKQAVAIYMAGEEPVGAKGVHTIMGGELARVLSESEKYIAVDRTEAILEQLDREHVYQRGGAVDDAQIKAIGHQLGVQYLCISNINAVGKRYYLDTRLVDVVTAEIARSVTATSTLKDATEMSAVGRNIALELLEAEKTRRQRALKKKIFRYTAIGLDVLGAGVLAYGYMENNNVVRHKKVIWVDADKHDIIANGPEADRAATRRNAAYVVGGILAAGGVAVHIVF